MLYFELVLFFSLALHNVWVLVLHKLLNLKSQARNLFGLCLSVCSATIEVVLVGRIASCLSISVTLLAISDLLASTAHLLFPSSSGHLYPRVLGHY
ncbi:hypothetical protein K1719_017861 [Acacia pycnantha]|nr:hypothetical protein K1719_017861 [Acacia pycnantha]